MENSKIEWTDHTFNGWIGCQEVSPACGGGFGEEFGAECYARHQQDTRYHNVQWGPHGERRRTSAENWKKPLRWAREARGFNALGHRPRVFAFSLADWLDNKVPQAWRVGFAALIAATPELDWLSLTKRIENYAKLAPWSETPENVWLGTTAENQEYFDRRWPILQAIPARVRFISCEPMIGPLTNLGEPPYPDWIICGGQDGPRAKEFGDFPQHARDLRDLCAAKGIAFFMKQMTKKAPIPDDLLVRQFPER
jgi:protein gp37